MAKRDLYTIEFPVRCSPSILYNLFSNAAGLSEWFAEQVSNKGNEYSFSWEGNVEKAILLEVKQDEFAKFKWDWMEKNEYFEFKIENNPITNETVLMISDFANKNDIKDQQQLWESQIHELMYRVGS